MNNLIDKIAELIYVVDMDSYELQYINHTGRMRFGISDIRGQKCYEVIHGRTEPCEFCNNDQLSDKTFITWECENQKVGRHYLLKDSLIQWNAKKAKVEIACDITEQVHQKEELREMLDIQNVIVECVQMLHSADDILRVLDQVIGRVGSFLHARRAYIYESCPEEGVDQAQVWYSPDVLEEERDYISKKCSLSWRNMALFDDQQYAAIDDIGKIRNQNPEGYAAMKSGGITSFIAVPLELEQKCIGYIEIDNPPEDSVHKIVPLISTLAYFISSCMCIYKNRRRLERISYTDSLTGIQNRTAYNQLIKELEHGGGNGIGVIYIDINDMKGINDRYGHSYGDHILVDLAKRITDCFQGERTFRINGDEFIVICQNMTKIEFAGRVQTLVRNVETQREYGVSMGHQWSEKQENVRSLIAVCDKMMYEDKKGFYFERPMPRHCRYHYDEIKELLNPDTLGRKLKEGEFLTYIQPKMAVEDRRLIGAEALVRYQNEEGLIISPDRFIPLLEENWLIDLLDFHVYENVCRQIKTWEKMGIPVVPVSVNFSRYTLMDVSFLDRLKQVAANCGIDRRLVEIEVTESADTDESFDLPGIVAKIRQAGFVVAIDDFGVKYANLFLFATMDFDTLKIDKSLVNDLAHNEKARAVLCSICDICRRMNIEMIVEGIETEEQLNILEEIGCYGVQGYYFSRPIPALEFESRYLRRCGEKASA